MQQRVLLVVLAFALALSAASASRVLSTEDGSFTPARTLLQTANARCPDGCATGYCQQDATMAGLRCTKCSGSLIVKLSNGRCSCPRGKYSDGNLTATAFGPACFDCPKSYYCAGGDFFTGVTTSIEQCPSNMTTIGRRTETIRGCVNMPGYYYVIDSTGTNVTQVECPANTYSPGLKKQRACVPCPTGFTTRSLTGRTRPTDCVVPAGYYLKAPGQVAPCPMGEYKELEGLNGNCTKCAFGVTTKSEGSTSEQNCTDVVAGRYATAISGTIVTATQICPQKYYCPGGTPYAPITSTTDFDNLNNTLELTIYPCVSGLWTQDIGSISADQCLTPPGFKTASLNTTQCAAGEYRADWKPANLATNCLSCGVDVYAETTDRIKVYDLMDPTNITYLAITSSSDDCYIKPGQGLYYSTITGSWRSRECDSDTYGVSNITYGLTPAACRDCPANMVARNDSTYFPNSTQYLYTNDDGTSGFISALACVTAQGWGYNGRIAQQCDRGTYNGNDTRTTCTQCGYGLTTEDVGLGYTEADCGLAAGFGYHNISGNYSIVPCPIGTYNNVSWSTDRTLACTACPNGTTTEKEGSDSPLQCNLCIPGNGGVDCADTCGGVGVNATYGPPGRNVDTNTSCLQCNFGGTGFSFEYNLTNVVYAPRAVSRDGANSSIDCLTEFTQIVDGAWYMPIATTIAAPQYPSSIEASFEDCLAQCSDDNCQFVNFNYDDGNCTLVTVPGSPNAGDYFVAWKIGPSGDTAVNAFSKAEAQKKGTLKAKAVASGFYSWFQDVNARTYGTQVDAVSAFPSAPTPATTQDCLNLCDDDTRCAGVTFDPALTGGQTSAECKLVYGDATLGVFTRTMLRTGLSVLARPAGMLD